MSLSDARVKFRKIFANLPAKIRSDDIIAVIDDSPYTWNSAYFEISNNTETGDRILKKLVEMKLI